jgi:midasin (ATPase involved in ribosome maturation)
MHKLNDERQQKLFENNLLKTFYKSYSLAAELAFKHNIYIDSSSSSLSSWTSQLVRCKQVMLTCKIKLNQLLVDWPSNPVLIELKKIIKRIESFDLNDSLLKYLTGLELLYHKSENWQLIGGKRYTIEPEMRLVNGLIVDWRKLELLFWQKNSLELEIEQIRSKESHVWFNHVFAICVEFLNNASNDLDAENNK